MYIIYMSGVDVKLGLLIVLNNNTVIIVKLPK